MASFSQRDSPLRRTTSIPTSPFGSGKRAFTSSQHSVNSPLKKQKLTEENSFAHKTFTKSASSINTPTPSPTIVQNSETDNGSNVNISTPVKFKSQHSQTTSNIVISNNHASPNGRTQTNSNYSQISQKFTIKNGEPLTGKLYFIYYFFPLLSNSKHLNKVHRYNLGKKSTNNVNNTTKDFTATNNTTQEAWKQALEVIKDLKDSDFSDEFEANNDNATCQIETNITTEQLNTRNTWEQVMETVKDLKESDFVDDFDTEHNDNNIENNDLSITSEEINSNSYFQTNLHPTNNNNSNNSNTPFLTNDVLPLMANNSPLPNNTTINSNDQNVNRNNNQMRTTPPKPISNNIKNQIVNQKVQSPRQTLNYNNNRTSPVIGKQNQQTSPPKNSYPKNINNQINNNNSNNNNNNNNNNINSNNNNGNNSKKKHQNRINNQVKQKKSLVDTNTAHNNSNSNSNNNNNNNNNISSNHNGEMVNLQDEYESILEQIGQIVDNIEEKNDNNNNNNVDIENEIISVNNNGHTIDSDGGNGENNNDNDKDNINSELEEKISDLKKLIQGYEATKILTDGEIKYLRERLSLSEEEKTQLRKVILQKEEEFLVTSEKLKTDIKFKEKEIRDISDLLKHYQKSNGKLPNAAAFMESSLIKNTQSTRRMLTSHSCLLEDDIQSSPEVVEDITRNKQMMIGAGIVSNQVTFMNKKFQAITAIIQSSDEQFINSVVASTVSSSTSSSSSISISAANFSEVLQKNQNLEKDKLKLVSQLQKKEEDVKLLTRSVEEIKEKFLIERKKYKFYENQKKKLDEKVENYEKIVHCLKSEIVLYKQKMKYYSTQSKNSNSESTPSSFIDLDGDEDDLINHSSDHQSLSESNNHNNNGKRGLNRHSSLDEKSSPKSDKKKSKIMTQDPKVYLQTPPRKMNQLSDNVENNINRSTESPVKLEKSKSNKRMGSRNEQTIDLSLIKVKEEKVKSLTEKNENLSKKVENQKQEKFNDSEDEMELQNDQDDGKNETEESDTLLDYLFDQPTSKLINSSWLFGNQNVNKNSQLFQEQTTKKALAMVESLVDSLTNPFSPKQM